MYLTRVELNSKNRATQVALSSYSMFHGAVESAFEPRQGRNLWRIDKLNGAYYLLLLSEAKPDMSAFIRQFCSPGTKAETKEYEQLLNRIKNGQYWHFRLVASPTYRIYEGKGQKGKIAAHLTEEKQMEWLMQKAEKCGFAVSDGSFRVIGKERKLFRRNKEETSHVNMLLVTFEGELTVTDTEAFCKALCNGIGREKAFGAGMLTVCGRKCIG